MLEAGKGPQMPRSLSLAPKVGIGVGIWIWNMLTSTLLVLPIVPCLKALLNSFRSSEHNNILLYKINISSDLACKVHFLTCFFLVKLFMKSIWMTCWMKHSHFYLELSIFIKNEQNY